MRSILPFASLLATVLCTPILPPQAVKAEYGRTLAAATRRSSLLTRSDDVGSCLKNKAELFYAESHNVDGEINYAAKVTVTSIQPILVLEELEHLLDDLICAPASITLSIPSFGSTSVLEKLRELKEGHIITSHSRCNADSERQAYNVLDVVVVGPSLVIFSVVPVSFKTAFRTIEVEMGYTEHSHELRSTSSIARRNIQSYSLPLNGVSMINKGIITEPGNFPVDISCKNCSLWGDIDLEFASFSWNCGDDPFQDSLSDCLSGTATASAKGIGGRIELEASLAKSWEAEIPLLPAEFLPSVSVQIPNIGSGSLKYGPYLDIGYHFNGNIDVTYGFEMQVPDGAKVWLDVADPSKSGASGFAQTKVETIPFQSSAKIQTLGVHAALRSQIVATFNFDSVMDISGSAKAKVYVDTPLLKAQVTPVKDVDINCQPISSSSGSQKQKESLVLTDAIHLDFTSSFDFGYYLGAQITVMSDSHSFTPLAGRKNITKPEPLANMCLEFDEKTQSYEPAAKAVSKAESRMANAAAANAPTMFYALGLTAVLFAIL